MLPEAVPVEAFAEGWIESAHARWRAITGAHLVPLVRAGARFENGVLVERPEPVVACPSKRQKLTGPADLRTVILDAHDAR